MTEHSCSEMHGSCSCGCSKCGCGSKHHSCQESEGCQCVEKFFEIADEAWREVLKEKIKNKILSKKGEHLEQLAEIIAVANGERWKNKISIKIKGAEFKDKIKELFSSCE